MLAARLMVVLIQLVSLILVSTTTDTLCGPCSVICVVEGGAGNCPSVPEHSSLVYS